MSEERNFRSVPELVTSIKDYIGKHNENPKTFIWTANQGYRNLGHQPLGVIEPDADTVIYNEQEDT